MTVLFAWISTGKSASADCTTSQTFLEFRGKKRPELVELIPELEEVSRGTEALPTEVRTLAYTRWTRLLSVPGPFTMVHDGGDERTSHEAKRSARPS